MAGRIAAFLDSWHQRRTEARWAGLADRIGDLPGSDLRAVRTEARGLRRKLDQVLLAADMRIGAPAGSGLPHMPLGTDWVWRPDPWRGRLPDPGAIAAGERTALADNLALYHDCPLGEITARQVRNQTEADRAPYGLALDVLGFRGSFLSLALNLPEDGVTGLKSRHLIRVEVVIDSDRPVRAFVRLNIKHGPNLSQPVSNLTAEGREKVAEFDLAYADLNDARIERAWVDLILNDVEMVSVHLRDVVLSRRPRAEL
jgi:hypothetical protein